ncbi:MAG: DUF3617 domain-containing protein [Proteobacteria bacterium]|nr:DUF3617 domain-containing protein [Pseudomonadota bacterium]
MKRFFLILIFFLVTSAQAVELKEGLWEMTTKMEMKGMSMQIPAQTFRQCITKDKAVPVEREEMNAKCKVVEQKVSGNTIYWKIICKDKGGETIITGKGTYNNDKFEGETRVKTPDGMEMLQHMTGKWVGKCK